MTKAPDRIWAWHDRQYDVWTANTHGDVRYTPKNATEYVTRAHADELVAAVCEGVIDEAVGMADGPEEANFIERELRKCLPDNAQAALSQRDTRIKKEGRLDTYRLLADHLAAGAEMIQTERDGMADAISIKGVMSTDPEEAPARDQIEKMDVWLRMTAGIVAKAKDTP